MSEENSTALDGERLLLQLIVAQEEHSFWVAMSADLAKGMFKSVLSCMSTPSGDMMPPGADVTAQMEYATQQKEIWAHTLERSQAKTRAYAFKIMNAICPEWAPGNTREMLDQFDGGGP